MEEKEGYYVRAIICLIRVEKRRERGGGERKRKEEDRIISFLFLGEAFNTGW